MTTNNDTAFHRFQRAGGSEQQLLMLEAALRQSPQLNAMAVDAMRAGSFTRLSLLDSGTRLGEYSGYWREIGLAPRVLNGSTEQTALDRLTDVFAHELSHALSRKEMSTFSHAIEDRAYDLAAQPGLRDATGLVREYIDKGREQESKAEIAGLNAVADRIRAESEGKVTEADLAERLSRAGSSSLLERTPEDGFRFKPGIELDPITQRVQATPENVEAVARHFFDVDRGEHSYREFYASAAISALARGEFAYREAHPMSPVAQTRIDLAALDVDRTGLRGQTFDFGDNPPGPFHFIDSSRGGYSAVDVAHTGPRRPAGAPEIAFDSAWPELRPQDDARPTMAAADPNVERFLRALECGDDAAAREASKAFAASAAGMEVEQDAEARLLAGYRDLPGRDHPLFVQALGELERLGSDAGGFRDRVQMEDMAGAIAVAAVNRRMPAIDVLAIEDCMLTARRSSGSHYFHEQVAIDPARAPPLEGSLSLLHEDAQQRHQLLEMQQTPPSPHDVAMVR